MGKNGLPNRLEIIPLDVSLEASIESLTADWLPERVCAARHLLGLDEPLTVVEAAQVCGGSRESARRAAHRLAAALREHADGLATHPALALLAACRASTVKDAAKELRAAGLLTQTTSLTGVLRALTTSRLRIPVRLTRQDLWVEPIPPKDAGGLLDEAVAVLRHGAPLPLVVLAIELSGGRSEARADALLEALRASNSARLMRAESHSEPFVVAAGDDPEAFPVPRKIRRTLAVTGPLPVASLLLAWQRQKRLRNYVPLPDDVRVMRAWLAGLRGFDVRASTVGVVDAQQVRLDRTTSVLAQVLSARPDGMSRADVLAGAAAAGLAPASASAALSYHPAVMHAGRDLWRLRGGTAQDDSIRPLEGARDEKAGEVAGRPRGTRAASFTWAPTGELVLRAVYTGAPSPLLYVPAAIRELVEGRSFVLKVAGCSEGPVGRLRMRAGNAWGFGPLLSAADIRPHGVVEIRCDLVSGTAYLQPGRGVGHHDILD